MIGSTENESLKIIPGNWVPVIYKSKWYVVQVLQLDNSDDTYFVTFLETAEQQNTKVKYHSSPDEDWINTKHPLCNGRAHSCWKNQTHSQNNPNYSKHDSKKTQ